MGKYIDSFKIFEAKYQTYLDYGQTGDTWATPEEVKRDAEITVQHMIPKDWDDAKESIANIVDQSSDKKGIKFEVTLHSGDIIHLYKTGRFRGDWEVYFNKKRMKDAATVRKILSARETDLDQYLLSIKGYDNTWHYADDQRAYKNGQAHQKTLSDLYSKLSSAEQKLAFKAFGKLFKTDTEFKDFSGT